MRRLGFIALLLGAWLAGVLPAAAQYSRLCNIGVRCPSSRPTLSLNFLAGSLDPRITFTRASGATSALYTDTAGASFTTYGSGVARLGTFSSCSGFLPEAAATNYLLNSNSPATQTTGTLAIGSYAFFGNGPGSLAIAAGTAVGTGFGTITTLTGNFLVIDITTAGTVTVTVSGTVDWFDLQGQNFPTSHIVTTSTTATRAEDQALLLTSSFPFVQGQGTLVAKGTGGPVPSGVFAVIAEFDDGDGNNLINEGAASASFFRIFVNGGQTQGASGSSWATGSQGAVGISYSAAGSTLVFNGVVQATVGAGAVPLTITELDIGNSMRGSPFSPWGLCVKSIEYWPRVLSASQLQAQTQ